MRPHPSYVVCSLIAIFSALHLAGCSKTDTSDTEKARESSAAKPLKEGPLSVIFETDEGAFEIRLRPDVAPRSCANFVNLVNRGFYHGLEFAGANAVARGLGETRSVPEYNLPSEFSQDLSFDQPGVVAWSSMPRAVEGDPYIPHPTRFFIAMKPQSEWNLTYVPFGMLSSGADVLLATDVGDWIRSARVQGDPTWLLARYPDEIETWNQALDRAGLLRAGE